jgi:hypothetical protein
MCDTFPAVTVNISFLWCVTLGHIVDIYMVCDTWSYSRYIYE